MVGLFSNVKIVSRPRSITVNQAHMLLYLLDARVLNLKAEIIRSLVWAIDDDYIYHSDNMEVALYSLKGCASALTEKLKEIANLEFNRGSNAV